MQHSNVETDVWARSYRQFMLQHLRHGPTYGTEDLELDTPLRPAPGKSELQQFEEGAFHRWYHFVLGYSDQLVTEAFRELKVTEGETVLDPFCGTGTTLVEGAKRGLVAIGVDASPFAAFAARVKTRFSLKPESLLAASTRAIARYESLLATGSLFEDDETFRYLSGSGMLRRGWISPAPLLKALALKRAIQGCRSDDIREALILALVADLPTNIGNMKFGPQIYKAQTRKDVDPIPLFKSRVAAMAEDLRDNSEERFPVPTVITGDARALRPALRSHFQSAMPLINLVVCSPPYPTEHDYTRHTRLELAFIGAVTSLDGLRSIKRSMIRSHTKGIYKGDDDAARARTIKSVEKVAAEVEAAIVGRDSGFEKLYPTVVRAYFGGMRRHFISLFRLIAPGARAAYVVGDQAAYARVHIHTALLLAEVAQSAGFKVEGISVWRQRWATGIGDYLDENILYLRKP